MSNVRIQLRRDTAADWTSANPVLAEGEIGLERDTDQFKIGDGTTAWSSLAYAGEKGPQGPSGADAAVFADGSSFAVVNGSGTATENGTELVNAYNAAKTATPYGNALSSGNRFTVYVGPGTYTIGSQLAVDTDFINILSIDPEESIFLTDGILVTANTSRLRGIDVGTNAFEGCLDASNLVVENCTGGDYSFGKAVGPSSAVLGRFTNCTGGDYSFGEGSDAPGTFINCTGGQSSFGYGANASGIFTNCTAGGFGNSFGSGGNGIASGTFTDCSTSISSVDQSFGEDAATGTFINCKAGGYSFAGTASGTFINCTAGDGSFGDFADATGTFTNCTAGNDSFAFYSDASGAFTNCTAGGASFGYSGTASGNFIDCTGGSQSFGRQGPTSGTFTNCTAGNDSFGDGGTLSGQVFYSRLTSGTFQTPSSGGVIRLSLDGNNNEVNAG